MLEFLYVDFFLLCCFACFAFHFHFVALHFVLFADSRAVRLVKNESEWRNGDIAIHYDSMRTRCVTV